MSLLLFISILKNRFRCKSKRYFDSKSKFDLESPKFEIKNWGKYLKHNHSHNDFVKLRLYYTLKSAVPEARRSTWKNTTFFWTIRTIRLEWLCAFHVSQNYFCLPRAQPDHYINRILILFFSFWLRYLEVLFWVTFLTEGLFRKITYNFAKNATTVSWTVV